MSEQLKDILWMGEEMDFTLEPSQRAEATDAIETFLESAAATGLDHRLYPA